MNSKRKSPRKMKPATKTTSEAFGFKPYFPSVGELLKAIILQSGLLYWNEPMSYDPKIREEGGEDEDSLPAKSTPRVRKTSDEKLWDDLFNDWGKEKVIPSLPVLEKLLDHALAAIHMDYRDQLKPILWKAIRRFYGAFTEFAKDNATHRSPEISREFFVASFLPELQMIFYVLHLCLQKVFEKEQSIFSEPLSALYAKTQVGHWMGQKQPLTFYCLDKFWDKKMENKFHEKTIANWKNRRDDIEFKSIKIFLGIDDNRNLNGAKTAALLSCSYARILDKVIRAAYNNLSVKKRLQYLQVAFPMLGWLNKFENLILGDISGARDPFDYGLRQLCEVAYPSIKIQPGYYDFLVCIDIEVDKTVIQCASEIIRSTHLSRISKAREKQYYYLVEKYENLIPESKTALASFVLLAKARLTLAGIYKTESDLISATVGYYCASFESCRYRAGSFMKEVTLEYLGFLSLLWRNKVKMRGHSLRPLLKKGFAWWDIMNLGEELEHEHFDRRVELASLAFTGLISSSVFEQLVNYLPDLEYVRYLKGLMPMGKSNPVGAISTKQKNAYKGGTIGYDNSPLMEALCQRDLELAEHLVDRDCDLNFIDAIGNTCFTYLLCLDFGKGGQRIDLALKILRRETNSILLKTVVREIRSLILSTASPKTQEMMQSFIYGDIENGNLSFLRFVIDHENLPILQELVYPSHAGRESLPLDKQLISGTTPLSYAVAGNFEAVVQFLLEAKADSKALDYWGKTALDYAVEFGRHQMIERLVAKGAKQSCEL